MFWKSSRLVFAFIGVLLSGYILISGNQALMPLMMLSLGFLLLSVGFDELQRKQNKHWGYTSIIVSLFVFFVSIQSFLYM
ncbi:DUF3953 domain-containing protein [Oceanobacillus halotolerans]|uniref:DUF3953 domain-containing protein n=1 Tax=Oceanobacillus halotolerans TaxID=2663380 RepID=UPI0013DD4B22|nr:DUF3953 domain-containing protein [Oceanobacillus halotolerans]